jgi:hypothetical protein
MSRFYRPIVRPPSYEEEVKAFQQRTSGFHESQNPSNATDTRKARTDLKGANRKKKASQANGNEIPGSLVRGSMMSFSDWKAERQVRYILAFSVLYGWDSFAEYVSWIARVIL